MKYHTLFFRKLRKMYQNVSSVAEVIGALSVNIPFYIGGQFYKELKLNFKVLNGAVTH